MPQIIDGKAISGAIKDELKNRVEELKAEGIHICLAVIQVGNDPASSVYVGNKKKACAYIGIDSLAYELPEETTQEELMALIVELNAKKEVNGILVQLPLPKHINADEVIRTIDPLKDVDGFHRTAGVCVLHAGGHHSAVETFRHRDSGQGVRGDRQEQYRR